MPDFKAPDGTRLHYTDEGTGKPVLALAGLTRTGRDFDFLAPHLVGVRLIRPDYRGRGQSAWADPATYTIPTEAQDALALLDHLGLDRAAILGTSRGGLIGMGLAAGARQRLTGLCLVDIGPAIEQRGLDDIMGYLGRNPSARTYADAAAARARVMTGFQGVPESRWRDEVERLFTEQDGRLVINYDPRLRDAIEAAGAQPVPDLWPFFDAAAGLPLALIRGETSNLLSRDTADEMRRRRPDMIFAEVPGRGHVPFLDEPHSLDVITRWLDLLP